ncbi:MAG: hypothetical protein AAB018_01430, partial [Actinomycetota bacterium]
VVLSIYERRRLLVLGVITLVALPFIWPRTSDSSSTSSTTVTTTTVPTGDLEIPSPVFLGGPEPISPSGSAAIAYPQVLGQSITGTATYSNLGYTESPVCSSIDAPIGITITVTNINNGRKVTCVNVFSLLVPAGISVVLHTTVFEKLGDVVDAPIPVTISW